MKEKEAGIYRKGKVIIGNKKIYKMIEKQLKLVYGLKIVKVIILQLTEKG